ncbi:hypothetical protein ACFFLZ_08430 [Photobacterium aphoticum]|uniref:Uncharacterized protein n=1 Tax=Photobacterium aphoticum TaxID=754436 RepID=A0A0J1GH94_9GAMM|nr:hypothetical protein [Photobacterium aphoticum]KLU99092.1 hypothetical protein ABT58_18945 [Photobacterium aphoticum]PSU54888.1 hypothetical protein C9I90_18550 [Photobacterium aphoticum]GHA45677.1 hypothetical protein GCM10007086_19090 [Photobacterium aphoticum]
MTNNIRNTIFDESILYEWECRCWEGGVYDFYAQWGIAFFSSCPVFIIVFFVSGEDVGSYGFWLLFFTALFLLIICRYILLSDYHFHYRITPNGFYYTQRKMLPDFSYKAVRGFSWIGIAICIIAFSISGPLVFVGAGGFALIVFGLTNFEPQVDRYSTVIAMPILLFNPKNDTRFYIQTKDRGPFAFHATFYTQSFEQKNEIIRDLSNLYHDLEVCNVDTISDRKNHPVSQKLRKEAEEMENKS